MSHINLTRAVFLTLSCLLAGCANNPVAKEGDSASYPVQAATVPVFVVPNCQSLGGEQRCQWIEPRGFERDAPTPSSVPTVQGIAL